MSVTTKDLARICKVSRTSVVRALNNQKGISDTTRKMILDKAEELGYRTDMLAKGLAQGKTMYIGVVVFDVRNRYFAQMLSAIENEARTRDYFVNITLHKKNKIEEKELIQRLLDYRVDGLILSPVSKDDEFADFLRNLQVPYIIIGNKVANDIPYVGIDEEKAAMEAALKIAEMDYSRIFFVCPPLCDEEKENIYSHKQREKGFLRAMKQYPDTEAVIISSWNYVEEAVALTKDSDKRTAYFCSGDEFALDILKGLRAIGKRAPRDFGIMGFDNIDTLDYIEPKLSTTDNAVEEVGKKAVQLLFEAIDGNEIPVKNMVEYQAIEGETI